jgi:predicted ester cyclase
MNRIILILGVFILTLSFSANSFAQDSKTDKERREMIKEFTKMFNKGDFSKIEDYIDPAYIEHNPMPGQKPGLGGIKDAMEEFHKAYPDVRQEIKDIIIEGDKASVLFRVYGTNTQEFMGMKPTGKKFDVMGVDIIKFKGKKLVEHWGYMEEMKWMQQLGMMPEYDSKHDPDKK